MDTNSFFLPKIRIQSLSSMRIWLRSYYTGTKKLFLKYCFERTERWRYGSEEHGNWLFMLTVFPKKTKLRLWLKLLQRGRRRSHNCWCIQTRSTFPMRIRFQEAKWMRIRIQSRKNSKVCIIWESFTLPLSITDLYRHWQSWSIKPVYTGVSDPKWMVKKTFLKV